MVKGIKTYSMKNVAVGSNSVSKVLELIEKYNIDLEDIPLPEGQRFLNENDIMKYINEKKIDIREEKINQILN